MWGSRGAGNGFGAERGGTTGGEARTWGLAPRFPQPGAPMQAGGRRIVLYVKTQTLFLVGVLGLYIFLVGLLGLMGSFGGHIWRSAGDMLVGFSCSFLRFWRGLLGNVGGFFCVFFSWVVFMLNTVSLFGEFLEAVRKSGQTILGQYRAIMLS